MAYYTFYIYNDGKYPVYINSVSPTNKKCIAEEGTTEALVQQACDYINPILKYYDNTNSKRKELSEYSEPINPGELSKSISYHIIYEANSSNNIADDPFRVEIDDIIINLSSVPKS